MKGLGMSKLLEIEADPVNARAMNWEYYFLRARPTYFPKEISNPL